MLVSHSYALATQLGVTSRRRVVQRRVGTGDQCLKNQASSVAEMLSPSFDVITGSGITCALLFRWRLPPRQNARRVVYLPIDRV